MIRQITWALVLLSLKQGSQIKIVTLLKKTKKHKQKNLWFTSVSSHFQVSSDTATACKVGGKCKSVVGILRNNGDSSGIVFESWKHPQKERNKERKKKERRREEGKKEGEERRATN